jgi:signal transduction histidine kinase
MGKFHDPAIHRGVPMTEDKTPLSNTDTEANAQSQLVESQLKLQEVAELVAHIRHEINNPLTGILGQAQLLLREDLNERARKRAQTIESLAMRLRDIVGKLREVQKPVKDKDNPDTASQSKPAA